MAGSRRGWTVVQAGPAAAAVGLIQLNAPGWLTVTVVLATALLALTQIVFPQDSEDRLDWWRARWNRLRVTGVRTNQAPDRSVDRAHGPGIFCDRTDHFGRSDNAGSAR
jgi:hypothetical protein